MPSGDTPVSNSSVERVLPSRTVTSAEKPCSARSPASVRPPVNCGAVTIPVPNGGRMMSPSETSRASKKLSTSVVTVTSSTARSGIGSATGPPAGRGVAAARAAGPPDSSHTG